MNNKESQSNIWEKLKNNLGSIIALGACFAFAVSIYNLPNEVEQLQKDVRELQGQFEEAYKNQISKGLTGQQHKEVLDILFKLNQLVQLNQLSNNNGPENTK